MTASISAIALECSESQSFEETKSNFKGHIIKVGTALSHLAKMIGHLVVIAASLAFGALFAWMAISFAHHAFTAYVTGNVTAALVSAFAAGIVSVFIEAFTRNIYYHSMSAWDNFWLLAACFN